MRGFLLGVFALVVLEVLVSNDQASRAFGRLGGVASSGVARIVDRTQPAIGGTKS